MRILIIPSTRERGTELAKTLVSDWKCCVVTSFTSTKTSWDRESYTAHSFVLKDLKKNHDTVLNCSQLVFDKFRTVDYYTSTYSNLLTNVKDLLIVGPPESVLTALDPSTYDAIYIMRHLTKDFADKLFPNNPEACKMSEGANENSYVLYKGGKFETVVMEQTAPPPVKTEVIGRSMSVIFKFKTTEDPRRERAMSTFKDKLRKNEAMSNMFHSSKYVKTGNGVTIVFDVKVEYRHVFTVLALDLLIAEKECGNVDEAFFRV